MPSSDCDNTFELFIKHHIPSVSGLHSHNLFVDIRLETLLGGKPLDVIIMKSPYLDITINVLISSNQKKAHLPKKDIVKLKLTLALLF